MCMLVLGKGLHVGVGVNIFQSGESHPYQFKITTVDRIYTFAAENAGQYILDWITLE